MEDIVGKLEPEIIFSTLSERASMAINRKIWRDFRLSNLSITPEQWMMLLSLSFKDGISQQELASVLYKDKPSVSRLIANLEKMKLIRRSEDRNDKRINLIYLTKKGREIFELARKSARKTMQCALQNLEEDEVMLGQKILKKIFNNLL